MELVWHLPEAVRRAVVQQAPGLIAAAPGLPTHPPTPGAGAVGNARRAAGDEAERAFLERGLREVGGTVAELARRCAMNRSHLQVLLKKHGLRASDFRTNRQGAAAPLR